VNQYPREQKFIGYGTPTLQKMYLPHVNSVDPNINVHKKEYLQDVPGHLEKPAILSPSVFVTDDSATDTLEPLFVMASWNSCEKNCRPLDCPITSLALTLNIDSAARLNILRVPAVQAREGQLAELSLENH